MAKTETAPASTQILFEEWRIKEVKEDILNPLTRRKEKIVVGYTKDGEKPKRTTFIDQEHADNLNAQAENSRLYLYKEGQKDFLPKEMFL